MLKRVSCLEKILHKDRPELAVDGGVFHTPVRGEPINLRSKCVGKVLEPSLYRTVQMVRYLEPISVAHACVGQTETTAFDK